MNLQFYLEKLNSSEAYKKFKEENPDTFFCSAFFVIDKTNLKSPDNRQHFDCYIPSKKKMFSFQLENGIKLVPVEMIGEKKLPKILLNYDFDFEEMERIIVEKMEQQKIKNKIQKIFFSLQNLEGKDFLIGTVFISTLGLLKVNIDIAEKRVTEFIKKSFFDMIKITKKDRSNKND
jgi:hypothetical protein